jgi:PIN domain nuclease of toxin-antitoxin system
VRLLLDTHIWVWSLLEPERLGKGVTTALLADDTELWLSPLSVWELLTLIEAGRIEVDDEPHAWVGEALRAVPMREATLNNEVVVRGRRLRLRDADAVDRLIAATALVYDLTLVTADTRFAGSQELRVLANR